jgi:hypothetical protein
MARRPLPDTPDAKLARELKNENRITRVEVVQYIQTAALLYLIFHHPVSLMVGLALPGP